MFRPWICLSSSSGQTFKAVYRALHPEAQKQLKGFFVDRPCGALEIARAAFGSSIPVLEYPRKEFEASALEWIATNPHPNAIIFLCGFFGILSSDFLARCPYPIVNTHPSLLPAFPGKDEVVHRKAFEESTLSGFSLHLVTEKLDGGPIVFQHPVALDVTLPQEANRELVRSAEQKWLPRVFSRILETAVTREDRELSTRALRAKYDLNFRSFSDLAELKTEPK